MAHAPRLFLAGATALLALSACNATGSQTNDAATAADTNAVQTAPDVNQGRDGMADQGTDGGTMNGGMTDGGMMNGHREMGMDKMQPGGSKMKGKMPMGDSMSNMQSMPKDKADKPMAMEDEMGEM